MIILSDKDGKLRCPNCKRTFTKERHFKTHKCLASSLYVDISKKEIVKIDSGLFSILIHFVADNSLKSFVINFILSWLQSVIIFNLKTEMAER